MVLRELVGCREGDCTYADGQCIHEYVPTDADWADVNGMDPGEFGLLRLNNDGRPYVAVDIEIAVTHPAIPRHMYKAAQQLAVSGGDRICLRPEQSHNDMMNNGEQ